MPKLLKCGCFTSVEHLEAKVLQFIDAANGTMAKPFNGILNFAVCSWTHLWYNRRQVDSVTRGAALMGLILPPVCPVLSAHSGFVPDLHIRRPPKPARFCHPCGIQLWQ